MTNAQKIMLLLFVALVTVAAVRVVDKFNVNQFYEAVGIVNIKSGASLTNIIVNGITNVGPSSGFGVTTTQFNAYTNYAQTNFVLTSAITNIIQNVATNAVAVLQTNTISYFNNGAGSILNTVVTNRTTNVIFAQLQISLVQGASGVPTVSFLVETNANTGTYSSWGAFEHRGASNTAVLVITPLSCPINPGCRYYYTNQSSGGSSATSAGWRTSELILAR